jgi:PST family polysaccharide transporter
MNPLAKVRQRFLGEGRSFAGAMGAMMLSEGTNRITRLITAVVMARYLTPWEFGIVAIAMTTAELLRVLTSSGLGAAVIKATDDELEPVCSAARRLTFWLYAGVLIAQLALAYPVAKAFGEPSLAWLVAGLAIPLAIYPFASVNVFRVQRARRARTTASMLTMQLSLDNLLVAILLMSGFGVWAVVWPKILCAVVWVVFYRRLEPWQPVARPSLTVIRECWRYSRKVLGSECLQALRTHADKLIIAKLIGIEAAGLYYFAFNAGVGITTGLINAFVLVLLPEISACRSPQDLMAKWRHSTGMIYAVIAPLILAQVILAPWYVPLVFGAQWVDAVPLVMLLCTGALALPLWRSVQQLLRVRGQVGQELQFNLLLAVSSILCVAASAPFGLIAVAVSLLIVNITLPLMIAVVVIRQAHPTMKALLQ